MEFGEGDDDEWDDEDNVASYVFLQRTLPSVADSSALRGRESRLSCQTTRTESWMTTRSSPEARMLRRS